MHNTYPPIDQMDIIVLYAAGFGVSISGLCSLICVIMMVSYDVFVGYGCVIRSEQGGCIWIIMAGIRSEL